MLIGHAEQAATFRGAVTSGQLHHAWLLAGPQGIGKATFAQAAATWLLARAAGPAAGVDGNSFAVAPQHPTARLIAAGSHLDFRVVERVVNPNVRPAEAKLRSEIAIDQIVRRDGSKFEPPLAECLRTTPALSDWRVVMIDSLDEMNRNASNALLKFLEEPPPGTLFLCISHSPGRLLPTIRSRCRTLRFRPLADRDVDAVITTERPELDAAARQALVGIADGAPGRALRLADAGIDATERALTALAAGGDGTGQALALARSLAGRTATARYEAFLELVPAQLAAAAKQRRGARLGHAVGLWEQANALASGAVPLSLDPQAVAFELATLVSRLAE